MTPQLRAPVCCLAFAETLGGSRSGRLQPHCPAGPVRAGGRPAGRGAGLQHSLQAELLQPAMEPTARAARLSLLLIPCTWR